MCSTCRAWAPQSALVFKMAEQHLSKALPSATLDSLRPWFKAANGVLEKQAGGADKWLNKVRIIFRACLKANRTLLIDLYTAMVLEATGNAKIPQSHWDRVALCIPQKQRLQIKHNEWFSDLARHDQRRIYLDKQVAAKPGDYVLLFRNLWMKDLENANCLEGSSFIHSQWEGYLSDPRFLEVDDWRQRHDIPFHKVHTSGHASPDDLRRFMTSLSPKKLVPIHTATPDRFRALFPNVELHADGELWEV